MTGCRSYPVSSIFCDSGRGYETEANTLPLYFPFMSHLYYYSIILILSVILYYTFLLYSFILYFYIFLSWIIYIIILLYLYFLSYFIILFYYTLLYFPFMNFYYLRLHANNVFTEPNIDPPFISPKVSTFSWKRIKKVQGTRLSWRLVYMLL